MDFHRALSALFTNQAAVQPLLGSLGFPFNDGTSILTTALAAQSGGKKLDTPLGILPFDSLPTTNLLTPTKKIKLEDELCASPVSSRSSTVSSSHFSSPQRSPSRKMSVPIPEEKKDSAYFERRRKNNDAAKRSRDARRQKEEQIASKAHALERENMQLRGKVSSLEQEAAQLRFLLFSKISPANSEVSCESNDSTETNDSNDSKSDSTIEV
ncbi:Transcription factor ces-2 [Caenorhabditis elegans]|uniref:Transcription factor ces-2 n=1 Tax=Caenorhabditis elegans TaxID=6239 RepID=CES2_CAEEL|nr:Transcription factor ces-2 [Caenorhabditis elegans]Q94126.1 RecName: Full=Transcription factor ces-2; AltName: Full=Cell death specification protein 2 [Caenorhabditis elegans]AAC47277.1 CES-2 [Caenorhabditis elegans]CAB05032.1 Transcription factor ces-2 [Caenorhabditis elegans]|eukprot:NP_493610.1 Cell death specification protein 2 [Caenorhabditis elegans]